MDQKFILAVFGAIKDEPDTAGSLVARLAHAGDLRSLRIILDNHLVDMGAVPRFQTGYVGVHQAILLLLTTHQPNQADAEALAVRWLKSVEGGFQDTIDTLLLTVVLPDFIQALMRLGANPNRCLTDDSTTAFAQAFSSGRFENLRTLLVNHLADGSVPMFDVDNNLFDHVADPALADEKIDCAWRVMQLLTEIEVPTLWREEIAKSLLAAIGSRALGSKAVQRAGLDRYLWMMAAARPTAEQWEKILLGPQGDTSFAQALVRRRGYSDYLPQILRNMKEAGVDLDDPMCFTDGLDEVPLMHLAASNGNSSAVAILLELGASPDVTVARYGGAPRDARSYAEKHPETLALIMAWTARRAMKMTSPSRG
jgi:hypothetical protein